MFFFLPSPEHADGPPNVFGVNRLGLRSLYAYRENFNSEATVLVEEKSGKKLTWQVGHFGRKKKKTCDYFLSRLRQGTQNFGGIRVGNGPTEDEAEIIQHDQLSQHSEEEPEVRETH